jgi:hypothetical protein
VNVLKNELGDAMKKQNSQKLMLRGLLFGLTLAALSCGPASAQTPQSTPIVSPEGATVPRLVKLSGTVKDTNRKPLTGVFGITFALYKDEQGGAPLWLETQNVQLDSSGRYGAQLGASKLEGLPIELFESGEAR